jgi:(4S)-4-hydroxy-5-phosphonooxypentane-2,3-dione isomerase
MSRVVIVVEFDVKPEHKSQFLELMKGHAQRSRAQDGCQQFDVILANNEPNRVLLLEAWRDQAALDAHARGPMPGDAYKDWITGRKATRCTDA